MKPPAAQASPTHWLSVLLATAALCGVLARPQSLWAQAPSAPPAGAPMPAAQLQAPQPGAPPVPPGAPGGAIDWTLSDLLDGVVKMDQSGLPLNHQQAAAVLPALERVMQASQQMTKTEQSIKNILTKEQLALIEQAQRDGKLQPEPLAGVPSKPGEDPVIAKALEVLQRKLR